MYTIQLNKNKCAFIDDSDIEKVNKYHWFIDRWGYATSCFYNKVSKKSEQIRMHRLIMEAKKGESIDHIDRNKLNNQKSNLHFATQTFNMMNRGKFRNNKSGYKGVSWEKRIGKWRSSITVDRKQINLGTFSDIQLAIQERKQAERRYNFI